MKLTPEEVDHLALLARLALGEAEKATLTAQLNQIVEAVEKIDRLDLAGIEPTTSAISQGAALRDDAPRPSLSRAEALAAAPARTAEGFVVPLVVSEGA